MVRQGWRAVSTWCSRLEHHDGGEAGAGRRLSDEFFGRLILGMAVVGNENAVVTRGLHSDILRRVIVEVVFRRRLLFSLDFTAMLLAFFLTGAYAWHQFRKTASISTFCYVWGASVIMLLLGAVYSVSTGTRPTYSGGTGTLHYVTWAEYARAMIAAALGITCIAVGHFWSSRRAWRIALPEFIDSRAADPAQQRRWALAMLVLGLIPFLATGIYNPIALLDALAHGRLLRGNAGYLYSAGTYFAFFNLFGNLIPFGVAATAFLFWRRKPSGWLLVLSAFFVVAQFLSGTRSSAAELLALFILVPRYMGNRRLFWRLAIIGAILGFIVISVQFVYRSVGFEHVKVARALEKARPLQVLEGEQLAWTSQAMFDYGNQFHYLDGSSYLAVAVNPIPRIFWAGKPVGYSFVNARNLNYGPGTTMTSAWMGEAYANFGWIGVPVVGLIAGVLIGVLDVFIRRSGSLALSILIPLQIRWAYWVRGDSVFSLDNWLFGFILIMAIFILAGSASRPREVFPRRVGPDPAN
jgi:oligosaccharide repeat unit polymerase